MNEPTIILFDGVCNLCAGVVKFVIARDTKRHFRFAALQSAAAEKACARVGAVFPASSALDSVIVISDGRALERSDAVLAICARLPFPWPILRVFRVFPRRLRDAIYRLIARRRYNWFGKRDTCLVATSDWKHRFLEDGE
ncbi:MAG: DUF393 domain-containing protein [Planctomycetota bacterium]|jgi:predicted DCC family thiol-disulfide oxidoreductase YuxK|nr:MAG: DUF393 domain-containing protein [Planctomycetota bacterium]